MIREKRNKKKKRKFKLIVFLIILLLLLIGTLVVWKVFTVENVEVKGNKLYTNEQVQKFVLNDEYSWNSLYVVLKYRFLDTKKVPFVDTMEVSFKDPHTLKVHVYEKGIIGYLYISSINQNAYFDKDGFVAETSSKVIPDVPQVNGIDCDKVVLYEMLPLKDDDILKSLLTVTQTLKKYEIVPDSVNYEKNGDVSLEYGAIKVLLGNSDNLSKKILRLSCILPNLEGMKGTLHIENWTENTTDIVFDKST